MTENHCVDCGNAINERSIRCYKCSATHQWKDPKFRQTMKLALTNKVPQPTYTCQDCGKIIVTNATRCRSCATKNQWATNAVYRQTMSDAVSKSNIKRLEDPVYRKTFTERVSARWNDPSNNIRTIVSEAAKKQWRDPIFRKAKSENASICTRARWNDPDNELHTMLATTLENMWSDDDFRQKMSDKSRKQMLQKWKDPTFRQHITDCMKKHWTDVNGKLYRNAVMFRPSMLEYAFKLQLDNAHVKYVQQYKPDDYYKVYDFLLPDFNALVEIDGEFWHHSERAKQRGVPAKDAEKDNWAYDHGYNMVRIPECDLTPDVVDWMITELTREV